MQNEKPPVPIAMLVAGAVLVVAIAIGIVLKTASPPETVIAPPPVAQPGAAQEAPATTTITGAPIPNRSGSE